MDRLPLAAIPQLAVQDLERSLIYGFGHLSERGDLVVGEYPLEVGAGIADGRIRYREDIVDGLEQAPAAFLGLLKGRNFGKVIVRVDA